MADELVAERRRRTEHGEESLPDDDGRNGDRLTLHLRSRVGVRRRAAPARTLTLRFRSRRSPACGHERRDAVVVEHGRQHAAQELERRVVDVLRVPTSRRLGEPDQREQGEVGVRRRTQRVEQRRGRVDRPDERLEGRVRQERRGAGDVGETQTSEASGQRLRAARRGSHRIEKKRSSSNGVTCVRYAVHSSRLLRST